MLIHPAAFVHAMLALWALLSCKSLSPLRYFLRGTFLESIPFLDTFFFISVLHSGHSIYYTFHPVAQLCIICRCFLCTWETVVLQEKYVKGSSRWPDTWQSVNVVHVGEDERTVGMTGSECGFFLFGTWNYCTGCTLILWSKSARYLASGWIYYFILLVLHGCF